MENIQIITVGEAKQISFDIVNNGYPQIENAVIKIYGIEENNDALLLTESMESLAAGETIQKILNVTQQDYSMYKIIIDTSEEEIYYANNIGFVSEEQESQEPLSLIYSEYSQGRVFGLRNCIRNNTESPIEFTVKISIYDEMGSVISVREREIVLQAKSSTEIKSAFIDIESGYIEIQAYNDQIINMDGQTHIEIS